MRKKIFAVILSGSLLSTSFVNCIYGCRVNAAEENAEMTLSVNEQEESKNMPGGGTSSVLDGYSDDSNYYSNARQPVESIEDIENVGNIQNIENLEENTGSEQGEIVQDETGYNEISGMDSIAYDESQEEVQDEVQEEIDSIAYEDSLDSHEDDPVTGKLDKDDFENVQEWEQYLREHPDEYLDGYDHITASPSNEINVNADLRYTVTGLPYSYAIQKMYIKENEIYITQRRDTTTYLSRCEIDETTKRAVCKDYMTLLSFGHGQTLEYFEWKGKPYFWITCKANTAYESKWAMQIGRIAYEPNKTVDYTQICRVTDINYANKTGSQNGYVKRVDAAVSDTGRKILIWMKNTKNVMQYSWYYTDKINELLDEKESEDAKFVSFSTEPRLKAACIGTIVQEQKGDWILPNDSFQGMEFTDQANTFVVGGNTGELPQIAFMKKKGTKYRYEKLATVVNLENISTSEIEGIQLQEDCLYFGICNHDVKATEQYIYSIHRNELDAVQREHVFSDISTILNPQTCTQDEVTRYTCKYCAGTKDEVTKVKAGHNYQREEIVEPTLEADGYELYRCVNCGVEDKKVIYFQKEEQEIYINGASVPSSLKKTVGDKSFYVEATVEKGDGQLSYKTNNTKVAMISSSGKVTIKGAGKATITITASETKGYKKTSKNIVLKVVPKVVSLRSLKSTYRGRSTVRWYKNSSVTGYQIQYSKNSNFSSAKIATVSNKNTTTKTLTSLTRGKRYYVRIRTYNKISGVNYFSAWSEKKSVVVRR